MYALSMFVPILGLYCRTVVRGRIREQKGIEGSCFKDLLCSWCCSPCALAQEGQVFAPIISISNVFIISRSCKDQVIKP